MTSEVRNRRVAAWSRSIIRVLALCMVVLVVAAPAALAAWMDPETLSPAGQTAIEPQVAVDADGDAVVMWRRFDGTKFRAQARARTADGTLSPVQTLSAAGQDAFQHQVAVDSDGDALFVWTRSDGTNTRIQARARSAAGTLSAIQTVSPAGQDALDPQVAVDSDGDAVIVWHRSDGTNSRIQARARSAAGTLSAVKTLSAAGRDADHPQVGIDATGDAVFVWERFDGSNELIEARARSATGTLSAVQTLSSAGQNAIDPQVGVDADGDAVFVWQRSDGTNTRIQARARSAAGTLSAVQTLSPAGENAGVPQAAMDSEGDAVFVWLRFDGTNNRAQARARSAAGTLSAVQTLSPAGEDAFEPQVGVDADGDAVFVWTRPDATIFRIEARVRSATGSLSVVQSLSPDGQNTASPQVAVDADGDAVAAWRLSDGTYFKIQASAGP